MSPVAALHSLSGARPTGTRAIAADASHARPRFISPREVDPDACGER